MPTREEDRLRLLEKANSLPLSPGVYIMKEQIPPSYYTSKVTLLSQ